MKKLLITVAIHGELKIVKKSLEDKKQIAQSPNEVWQGTLAGYLVDVLVTSVGPEPALAAATACLSAGSYGGVLVTGFCGGMSHTLGAGDVVVASKVLGPDDEKPLEMEGELAGDLGKALISEGLKYRSVPLITQRRVLEKPSEKQSLFDKTGAEAVDMETYEVLKSATLKDIRSAAVKVVVDDLETELPPFNEYIKTHGILDHLGVKQVLTNHPQLSLRLRQFMKQGSAVLEKVIPQIVPVVCEHWKISR